VTSSAPFEVPPALAVVAAPVEARLRDVLAQESARWTKVDPDLAQPLDVLTRFVLTGGKRLRPAFCHWAFVGAGGAANDRAVLDTGAAFELLHAFALIHDDVMDGSARRRGEPTVHISFEEIHDAPEWHGEPRRFGEGVAILIGDLAEVFADRLMTGANAQAFGIWNELKIELNIGQYLDVLGTARGSVDLETARRIAQYKSGKYTIERPLHLGAALLGRLDEFRIPLSRYGAPLGEAFQLRDDILGAFGDSSLTGKPVGDDLREGKPTPLLSIAVQRSTQQQLAVLQRIGAPSLGADDIIELQSVLEETGARAEIESDISALTAQAISALDDIAFDTEPLNALKDLAIYVESRDR
jgi:geranylgeranyl diphosphate synthase type I